MKKTFKTSRFWTAPNCAAKMERGIAKIDGVKQVNVNFLTQRMTIEADDDRFEEIMDQVRKNLQKG